MFLLDAQTRAIRQALESRLTLIQGPPGTGKTKTACNLILSAVRLRRSKGGARRDGKVLLVLVLFFFYCVLLLILLLVC